MTFVYCVCWRTFFALHSRSASNSIQVEFRGGYGTKGGRVADDRVGIEEREGHEAVVAFGGC